GGGARAGGCYFVGLFAHCRSNSARSSGAMKSASHRADRSNERPRKSLVRAHKEGVGGRDEVVDLSEFIGAIAQPRVIFDFAQLTRLHRYSRVRVPNVSRPAVRPAHRPRSMADTLADLLRHAHRGNVFA